MYRTAGLGGLIQPYQLYIREHAPDGPYEERTQYTSDDQDPTNYNTTLETTEFIKGHGAAGNDGSNSDRPGEIDCSNNDRPDKREFDKVGKKDTSAVVHSEREHLQKPESANETIGDKAQNSGSAKGHAEDEQSEMLPVKISELEFKRKMSRLEKKEPPPKKQKKGHHRFNLI